MTDQNPDQPTRIVVPSPVDRDEPDAASEFTGLVNPRDLGSASRSCLAIIVVLLVIGLLLCVFLAGSVLR